MLCTALILVLTVQSALAQTVRGVLLEEGIREPISGAFIVLLDERGERPGQDIGTLTDEDGRFVLRVPEPGRYRLRAERIGFRSTLSDVIELAAGATVEVTIIAPVEAVELEALAVTGERECDVAPAVGRETAEVWEEARKALSVVDWGAQGILRYQVLRWERELAPHSLRVQKERTWPWFWNARGSLFRSRPAEDLAEHGYVRPLPADSFILYAPDAAVVLSESFADQHCFAVRQGRGDREGLIGLGFEPAPGRDLPDIEGVLWLDMETAELRDLEFRYKRLPLPVWDDDIGGDVEFERLPSGAWIVSRWSIRSPIVEFYDPLHPLDDRYRLAAIREDGGAVIEIRTAGGERVQRWLGTTLTGSVYDSTRAGPLAGATVYLVGTDRAAETDAEGRFEIDGLLEGHYSVGFSHPSLDSLTFSPDPVEVTLRRDRASRVQLAVPSTASILTSLCGERGQRAGTGAVVGVVRDSLSTTPVPEATVTATSDRLVAETKTDVVGRYAVCGVPAQDTMTIVATCGERASVEERVSFAQGRIIRRDLALSRIRVAGDSAVSPERWLATREAGDPARPGVVLGRVLKFEGGAPIRTAQVRLLGDETDLHRLTDGQGAFIFSRVPPGTYELVFEHLAYGTYTDTIDVAPGELVNYEAQLEMRAIELEPLVVTVERRALPNRMVRFYDRMAIGSGRFITRERIDRRQPVRITHMIGELPGVSVGLVPGTAGGSRNMVWFRRNVRLDTSGRPVVCAPALYVDGMLLWRGRPGDIPPSLDDFLNVTEVEAVEAYYGAASVPAEFSGSDAGCGVIAVWTRSGSTGDLAKLGEAGSSTWNAFLAAAVMVPSLVLVSLLVF